jgi:hypothetical protein
MRAAIFSLFNLGLVVVLTVIVEAETSGELGVVQRCGSGRVHAGRSGGASRLVTPPGPQRAARRAPPLPTVAVETGDPAWQAVLPARATE